MSAKFIYTTVPVFNLLRDIANYANIKEVEANEQLWTIMGIPINKSVIVIKKLLDSTSSKSSNYAISFFLCQIFNAAGISSNQIQITDDGVIYFSFKNDSLKIFARNGTLEYVFKDPSSFLNCRESSNKDIWQRLIDTISEFI